MIDTLWWLAAMPLSLAPRDVWRRFDARFPTERAVAPSAILTVFVGCAIGIRGFFAFAAMQAGLSNDWMLAQLAKPVTPMESSLGFVPYGISALTLFIYVFFTPIGLFSLYLAVSRALRPACVIADDARR